MYRFISILVSVVLLVYGCLKPPKPQVPKPDSLSHIDGTSKKDFEWDLVHEDLKAIVDEVVANNLDLQIALVKVEKSFLSYKQARSLLFPSLGANFSVSKDRINFVFPNVGRVAIEFLTNALSLNVSYIVDFFGKLRYGKKLAMSNYKITKTVFQEVKNLIALQTLNGIIQVALLNSQLKRIEEIRNNLERVAEVADHKWNRGLVSLEVKQSLERELSKVERDIAKMQEAYEVMMHTLEFLKGEYPHETQAGSLLRSIYLENFVIYPPPEVISVSWIDRRPDISRARETIYASYHLARVRLADLFPDTVLLLSTGYQADRIKDFFKDDTFVYRLSGNTGGNFTSTGERQSFKIAKLGIEEALLNYRKTVLNAVLEVENLAVELKRIVEELKIVEEELDSYKRELEVNKAKFYSGTISLEQLLVQEISYKRLEIAKIQLQAAYYINAVKLFFSLGGNWS